MNIISLLGKEKTKVTHAGLYTWNLWLAGLYAVQGAVILLLSETRLFPVNTSYLTTDAVASELTGNTVLNTAIRHLFDINLAYLVAAFLFVVALGYALAATLCRQWYEADLKKKTNRLRWIHFGVSEGLVLLAIALLSGVTDISALLMIFAFKVLMDLVLLVAEGYTNGGKNKLSRLAAGVAFASGVVPWVVLAIYALGAHVYGNSGLPIYVYFIYATALAACLALRVNLVMQQVRKVGSWKDYLYGEAVYMIIGFVFATAVVWQIFAGVLRP
jgi:hypothetical protein